MALSDYEKNQVITELDQLDDLTRTLILASLDAFAKWLMRVLSAIYTKIKDQIPKFWAWLKEKIG